MFATCPSKEGNRYKDFKQLLCLKLLQHKKEHPDEAIQNEVVGQAHMEHYAIQIFLYADNEDRAGRFGK